MSVKEPDEATAPGVSVDASDAETAAAESEPRRQRDMFVIVLLLTAALAPFLDRALHLDDPFYVWVAQHIAQHPFDFYGFTLNWNGLDETVYEINKNPPGISYYLALAGSLFGWNEGTYHAALMLVAIAAGLGIYMVAERMTKHALMATLVAVASPVFLLSSTNVMAEMGMLALYVWALYFWLRGIQEDRFALLAIGGALAALSTLTKYYGLSAIPLFLAYGIVEKRRIGTWTLSLLVPLAILTFYELYTARMYGQGHITGSIVYAEESDLRRHATHIRIVIGLAFAGGCMFPAAVYSLFLWPRWVLALMGIAILAGTSLLGGSALGHFFVVEVDLGEEKLLYTLQFMILIVAGINLFLLALRDLYVKRDAISVLLLLWLVGTFVFAVRLNWAINGRSLLAAAVPVGVYVARAWEMRRDVEPVSAWRMYGALIPASALAMAVTYADYTQANLFRSAAYQLSKDFGGPNHTLWYQGHWGFQYYMDKVGAKHTRTTGIDVTDGDFFVSPYYNTAMHNLHTGIVRQHWDMKMPQFAWLTAWNPQVGAGYYADSWGPMPFVITRVPPEQFVIAAIRYTGKLEVGEGASPSAAPTRPSK